MSDFLAVVMAGGSGTRFWPLSRARLPKQLLPLVTGRSMIRETVERLFPLFDAERVYVVCGKAHRDQVVAELEILPGGHVLDEPVGRDTAACVGLAATFLEWRHPGSTFCALPADAYIGDLPRFHEALRAGYEAAQGGALVTFGIPPTRPATGYGYLQRGEKHGAAWRVRKFHEKPDLATATAFVASGSHYWNSGIFVWRSDAILAEIGRRLPEHAARLAEIRAALGTSRLPAVLADAFPRIPKVSIDYGVMEHAPDVLMVEAGFEWDDVGSWAAAAARRPRDAAGNVVEGPHAGVDTRGCVVISTDPAHVVATLGIEDLVVVHTKDATLVCPKSRSEDLKKLVDELKAKGRESVL